jgi:hypothetical protein
MFTKSDDLSEDDIKEISLKFLECILYLHGKKIHPMDTASLFIFLGLTVWRTHTTQKDFSKLVEQFDEQDWSDFPSMQVMFPEVATILKDLEKIKLEEPDDIHPKDIN